MAEGTKAPPRFVNLQPSAVGVFDEKGNRINVGSYALHKRQSVGVFVVEGEHYRKFLAPYGPLSPLPKEDAKSSFRDDQVRRQGEAPGAPSPRDRTIMEAGGRDPAPHETPPESDEGSSDDSQDAGSGDQGGEASEDSDEGSDTGDDGSTTASEEEEEEELTRAEIRSMKKDDLVKLAEELELDTSGNKKELVARIISTLSADDAEDE